MYKRILIALILVCFTAPLFAQAYEKEFEVNFAWEVKQIDEFMERFNNRDKTLIKEYLKKNNNAGDLTREKLIKSLFNAQAKTWNFDDINAFIKEANDKPVYLDFFEDWYAKVDCAVTWNGTPEKASLILKLEKLPDNASKWVITGISAPFLKSTEFDSSITLPESKDKTISLNPVSHATDFMNISRITENISNIQNYFAPISRLNSDTRVFMQQCATKKLVVNKVSNISYHFLQVDNWIFEVKQFNRQTKNSGWLISRLVKASNEEKDTYRTKILKQL